MKSLPKNPFDEKRREVERSFSQMLDLNPRKPTGIAVELLARLWGFLLLGFITYLIMLDVLEVRKTQIIIWCMIYFLYLFTLEIIRYRYKPFLHNDKFRLTRIFLNIAFVSWLIAASETLTGVFGLLYLQPMFAAIVNFPKSKPINFLVIAGVIIGLFIAGVLASEGLSLSLGQFLIITTALFVLRFYFAFSNRITIQKPDYRNVSEIIGKVHSTQDLHDRIYQVMNVAIELSGADRALVVIVDPDRQKHVDHVFWNFKLDEKFLIEDFISDCIVLNNGEPFECSDMIASFGTRSIYSKYFKCNPRSVLAEPIFNHDGKVLGVISVTHESENRFDFEIKNIIHYFSFLIISAVENALSHQKQKLKAARAEIASKMLKGLDKEEEILTELMRGAQKLIPHADRYVLHRYRSLTETLDLIFFVDNNGHFNPHLPQEPFFTSSGFNIGSGVAGNAIRSRKVMLVPDTTNDPLFLNKSSPNSIRSLMVSPLFDPHSNEPLGTLSVHSQISNAFTYEDELSIEALTLHASTVSSWARELTNRKKQGGVMQEILNKVTEFSIDQGESVLCQQIVDTATKVLGFRMARIGIYDPEKEALVTCALSEASERESVLLKEKNLPLSVLQPFLIEDFHRGVSFLIPNDNEEWKPVANEYFYVSPEVSRKTLDWRTYGALLTPLVGQSGEMIGLLSLDEPIDDTLTQSRTISSLLESIAVFASAATWAIELARLENRLEDQRRRTDSFIQTISESFAKSKDFNSLGEVVVQIGAEFLNSEGCSLYLVKDNEVKLTHSNFLKGTSYIGRGKRIDNGPQAGLTSWVAATGTVYLSNNGEFKKDEVWAGEEAHLMYLPSKTCHSVLLAPVRHENGDVVGVITLENKKNIVNEENKGFNEKDVMRLTYLAQEFSRALELLHKYEIIQRWERKGLEDDLHEIINWYHSGVVAWLDSLAVWLGRGNVRKAQELIPPLLHHAHTTVDELKTIHTNLISQSLEIENIHEALRQITLAWSKRVNKKYLGPLPITLSCPENLELPVPIRINVIRIALGAIANSVLHSGVLKNPKILIHVKIMKNANRLLLTVSDTGEGCEPLEEGYGIIRMRLLVQELNELGVDGRLHIWSKTDIGTKVTLVLSFPDDVVSKINGKEVEHEN